VGCDSLSVCDVDSASRYDRSLKIVVFSFLSGRTSSFNCKRGMTFE